ncbi:cobaltochelatase CobT-related protein [Leekyejoonella antrihumi]|uniref:Cobalt chelatase n=1 Tax=Leekyejoonella antrihumi TaxID=1660198 RepID=A0A563E0W9_9MICO|nr:cobalt chelatase [Leekyejoonella antrihumi]TWP36035.1 cobalt chelatase [Leekyejoonella antrihumi]
MSTPVAPAELPALERARLTQRADELSLACVHALTGLPGVRRRGRHWYDADTRLAMPAPQLHPRAEEDTWSDFRGAADGVAGRLTFTDPRLYAEQSPAGAGTAALVFAVLEQVRVEALVPKALAGARRNLARRHKSFVRQFVTHGLTETERGLHVLAIDLTARVHVLGSPIEDDLADLVESTRWGLAGEIGSDLRALRRLTEDQRAYGECARRVCLTVTERLEQHQDPETDSDTDTEDGVSSAGFSLLVGFEGDQATTVATTGRSRVRDGSADRYHVFTRSYDRTEPASTVARADVLRRHRVELDALVRESAVATPVLARRLRTLLSAPQAPTWSDHEEQGVIDPRRLSGVITSPRDHRVFRLPMQRVAPAVSVTLLLDLSGSMRAHREWVATLVDLVSRALDQAGVVHEVLGFTTTTWQGGPARKEWERCGRPTQPGRLAALRHLVIKDAQSTWRRSRDSFGAILANETYKEGVDGEALQWAAGRAASLDTDRHLIVVLSDGSPSERSTALVTDEHYLGQHLSEVVEQVGQQPGFAVAALGLGLDLSPYYQHSLVVHDTEPASMHSGIRDLLTLLRG